ncbi:Uncharacterized protein dnm_067460 [Desulfonema magnum]|uniref:Uncharacterized protein n=1 Tax=Desulfonema magnum TaxID=45655 RepID=A0A975BT81_9BACT|nr:Uncharacterized protein dnm_067460 [Desulfonema magnum]
METYTGRLLDYFFTVKIHFENPGFLSENIFITGGEKPGFFMSIYFFVENVLIPKVWPGTEFKACNHPNVLN